MGKSKTQKNNEKLIVQQATDLEKLRESLPADALRAAEDKLLAQCLDIIAGSLDFAALGFNEDGTVDEGSVPISWEDLPLDVKARKIRLAKYGCLTTANVPHGVKMAQQTAIGIIKARHQDNTATRVFNMEVSLFPAPAPLTQDTNAIDADYQVIDLE